MLESAGLYRSCVVHGRLSHEETGSQRSEEPVSKQKVNCLEGVPMPDAPKYCTDILFSRKLSPAAWSLLIGFAGDVVVVGLVSI